jgi:hypothetical protein
VFGTDGLPVDPALRGAAPPPTPDPAVTDLLVLIHGWNDDTNQARSLYNRITASMAQVGGTPPGLGVLGVIWPSKQFDAPLGVTATANAITADPATRADFTEAVRSSVTPAAVASWADPGDQQDLFFGLDPASVFDRLATTTDAVTDPIEVGVANVLDLATYYEMKARSGLVGTAGIAPMLAAIRTARPDLALHLAGHSFGARAVAAALSTGAVVPVASASLLQGAFSHYGFAKHWDGIHDGLFRQALVGGRVTGPMVVTYSSRDQLVGTGYALASRLAGQDDSLLGPIGGPHDRFGAIGANGALATPESQWSTMAAVGGPLALSPGAVCNLDSKAYIANHFAVTGPEVAQAVVAAMWV